MWIRAIAVGLLPMVLGPLAGEQERGSPSRDTQIEQAVLAAPASMRQAATVLGYGGESRPADPLTVLRRGTNAMICLADDPEAAGFHVSCYHETLDAFMAIGRRKRAEGMSRAEVMDARYAALEAGEFTMPKWAVLYSISAEGDPPNLDGARRLSVVYVPGAMPEELGLPTRPDGDSPWLMLPGTPWAHIMIGR